MEVGLVAKINSRYRITKSGLGLLTQVDEVEKEIMEILKDKEEMKQILSPQSV